jgi:4-amino-4-deoxy-L-arabinose transferase-like glycosyltransferase
LSFEQLTRGFPLSPIRVTRKIKPSIAAYFLLLSFWFLTALHLDRYPANYPDEGWILSPGYHLLTQGSFGTSLFAGYYGAEQHLFDFMPLFAVVQGIAALVLGITSFTARFTNLALGMVLLALVYALARQWFNTRVGVIAIALNLLWVWGTRFSQDYPTAIPLMDAVRVARYDVLAAILSLAACWVLTRAWQSNELRLFWLTGFLLGLACLTHLYCFLWLPVIGAALVVRRIWTGPRFFWRQIGLVTLGVLMPLTIWFSYMILNWHDYVGQARANAQSFDFFSLHFYWRNLRTEAWRYFGPDLRIEPVGFLGLVLAGLLLPIAWLHLFRLTLQHRRAGQLLLILAAAILPLCFAILIDRKFRFYLIEFVPLETLLLAWYLDQLAHAPKFVSRVLAESLLVLVLASGVLALVRMHYFAQSRPLIDSHLRQVATLTPAHTRILGPVEYWIAFPQRDYRSFMVVDYLSSPVTYEKPHEVLDAFAVTAPDIVLLDAHEKLIFQSNRTPELKARGDAFWEYMRAHNAQLVATMTDLEGDPLEIYALEP